MFVLYAILFVIAVLVVLAKCKPDPILGVYEQPGPLGLLKQVYLMSCLVCHVMMTGDDVCVDPPEQEAGCAQGGGAGQGVAGAGRGRRHHRDGVTSAAGGPSSGL